MDAGALPQRRFPWDDTLRGYLREAVHHRRNCFNILNPRKETMVEYINSFLELKVKILWPRDWMTLDILIRESQVPLASSNSKSNSSKIHSSPPAHRMPTSQVPSPTRKPLTNSMSPIPPSRKVASSAGGKYNVAARKLMQPSGAPVSTKLSRPPLTNFSPRSSAAGSVKTIELTSGAPPGARTSPINLPTTATSALNEPEILNLAKNPSVSISKVNPPSLNLPLPAGTTISPAIPSQSSAHPRVEMSSSVSLTKHEPGITTTALSREVDISIAPSAPSVKAVVSHSRHEPSKESNLSRPRPESAKDMKKERLEPSYEPRREGLSIVKQDVWRDNSRSESVIKDWSLGRVPSRDIKKEGTCSQIKPEIRKDLPRREGLIVTKHSATSKDERRPESSSSIVREDVIRRENRKSPLPNIPDCIYVSSGTSSTNNDKYVYNSVRKRAIQEYLEKQQNLEMMKVDVPDKGVDMFTRMLDNCKPKNEQFVNSKSSNSSSMNYSKTAESKPPTAPAPAAPELTDEDRFQNEIKRVIKNMVELSSHRPDSPPRETASNVHPPYINSNFK